MILVIFIQYMVCVTQSYKVLLHFGCSVCELHLMARRIYYRVCDTMRGIMQLLVSYTLTLQHIGSTHKLILEIFFTQELSVTFKDFLNCLTARLHKRPLITSLNA